MYARETRPGFRSAKEIKIENKPDRHTIKKIKIMKKSYLLAIALSAMVSCTSDEFVGDKGSQGQENNNGEKAIAFASSTPRITRAGGSDAATTLGNKFKVYAVKKTGDDYSNVFAKDGYSASTDYNASPYWVWYTSSTAGSTSSNTKDWEYVGASSTVVTSDFGAEQTIKYWDYSASQYEFVAYSATDGAPTISKYQKDGFTVSGTAAQLAGLYVADKVTITNSTNSNTSAFNVYGGIVQLTFRSAGTKVRLGIYETIPGYDIKNVNFRPNATEFTATKDNAMLSGSFNGTSSSGTATYNVTYNATSGAAEFDNTATSANTYFDFGTFASQTTAVGVTSATPMWASGTSAYQSVFPNTDNVANMILYVDYDLVNNTSGETIHVTGAKAVVPQMYMKWNPNYAYTYLFKISDNTNGRTGGEGTPEGLYPITFDALTVAASEGSDIGTITTVSTPAITTYQEGSVSPSGIAYAASGKPIYITVNTNGTLATLNTSGVSVKLYEVGANTTEADLMLASGINKTEITATSGRTDKLSVLTEEITVNSVTFAANTTAKFIPIAGKTYAFEYNDGTTSYYKVIVVASGS